MSQNYDIVETDKGTLYEDRLPAHQEARKHLPTNPLDHNPVVFKQALQQRGDNYTALREWLFQSLVPDQDYARLHIAGWDKCANPYQCTYEKSPFHWSGYQLTATGADKVSNMLGMRAAYPGEEDYRQACLKGVKIEDVFMRCNLLDAAGNIMAEGSGAASRKDFKGDLNNTIKRAQKRARVDAVQRLPVVSALFENPKEIAIAIGLYNDLHGARKKAQPTEATPQNAARRRKFNQGVMLETYPLGQKLKGVRFRDMNEQQLRWIVDNQIDYADIHRSAEAELERRTNTDNDLPPAPRVVRDRASEAQSTRTTTTTKDTDAWLADFEGREAPAVSFDDLETPEDLDPIPEAPKQRRARPVSDGQDGGDLPPVDIY